MDASLADVAARLIAALLAPFHGVLRGGEKMYWLHLLASLALALVVHLAAGERSPFRAVFSRAVWTHRSSRVDLRWYFVNGALLALMLVPLLAVQHATAAWISGRLAGALGARESIAPGLGIA